MVYFHPLPLAALVLSLAVVLMVLVMWFSLVLGRELVLMPF